MIRSRPVVLVLALLGLLTALTACTASGGGAAPSSASSSVVTAPSTVIPTTPVDTGPTTTRTVSTCPLIASKTVAGDVGQRLGVVTVQSSAGRVVGCIWYGEQHASAECPEVSCLGPEDLPPAHQPDVEVSSHTYASDDAAHNAVVRIATATGTAQTAQAQGIGQYAATFENRFWYPHDMGRDEACVYQKGTTVVEVQTTVIDAPDDVTALATSLAAHF